MPRGPLAHAVFRHRARVVIPDTQVQQVEGHRQDRWWTGTKRPEATMEARSCGACATRGERASPVKFEAELLTGKLISGPYLRRIG